MGTSFVPNLSTAALIVASLRPVTQRPFETHQMISDPDLFLEEFSKAASHSLFVHWKATTTCITPCNG